MIAEGLKVVGSVTTEGTVEVDGQIDGELHCTLVTISRKAQVAGTVEAERVVVDGKVEGPIQAGEVVLKSHAHVVGDIQCRSLTVEKGACVQGRLARDHQANARQPEIVKPLGESSNAVAAQEEVAEWRVGAEESTRIAELVIEARHLSANPNLLNEEALAFLVERGNAEAKAFLNGPRWCLRGGKAALLLPGDLEPVLIFPWSAPRSA